MVQLAANVVLNELDAERALLGTFFATPERFSDLGADINPEWFSDSIARYMFEECMKIAAVGHTLTTSVVISMLPDDCNGVPRASFYANVRMAGLPQSQISGVIATLRDRWARRQIISIAEGARTEAMQFGAEPFQLRYESL